MIYRFTGMGIEITNKFIKKEIYWKDSEEFAKNIGAPGYGWRIPTINELKFIYSFMDIRDIVTEACWSSEKGRLGVPIYISNTGNFIADILETTRGILLIRNI